MSSLFFKKNLYSLILLLAFSKIYSQSTNIDFSSGISGWTLEESVNLNTAAMTMSTTSASTQYSVMAAGATEINGAFITMISPLGGNYMRIGRTSGGLYAHKLKQTFRVTAAQPGITLSYAMVHMNYGYAHYCNDSPYFNVVLKDSLGNVIGDPNLHYSSASTTCDDNFTSSGMSTTSFLAFKNWTQLTYSLQDYISTNITVEFIASGCTDGSHAGYAYLDAAMCSLSSPANILSINTNTYNLVQSETNILVCGTTTANISAPAGATSYSWTGPGINGSTTQNVSITQAGFYKVVFNNPTSCSNTTTVNFRIGPTPIVGLSLSSNTVCAGSSLTYTTSGANSYLWSPNDPQSQDIFSSTYLLYPAASVNYTLTGYNTYACKGFSNYSVTVVPNPVLSITGNTATCFGVPATLTAAGANTYTWTGNVYTNSITVTPTVTSNYFVTGKSTTTGCSSSTLVSLTVAGNVAITPATKKVCIGDSILVTASGATSYTWSTGAYTNTVSLKPTTTTSYTLFWATPACGTYSTAFTVTVNPVPVLSISYSNPVCSGKSLFVSANSAVSTTYTWSNGATTLNTNITPSASAVPYTFTCSVSATNSLSCKSTTVTSIFVNPTPALSANFPPSICLGNPYALNLSGADTYSLNSAAVSGSSVSINPAATTNYTLNGNSFAGCTSSLTSNVLVNAGAPSNMLPTTSYTVPVGSTFYLPLGISADSYTTNAPYTSYDAVAKYFVCGPITSTVTQVYSITGTNACGISTATFEVVPAATPTSQTQFWGTTTQGGPSNAGVIFRTNGSGRNLVVEYTFSKATSEYPQYTKLVAGPDGNLYGMASMNTLGYGTIFQYDPSTGIYSEKVVLQSANGGSPNGSLLLATDGMFYGLTSANGANGFGTLFQYNPSTNVFTKKMDFSTANGTTPYGSLIQAANGKLYGMTNAGGTNNMGVVFQYDITSNTYSKMIDFAGTANGASPYGSLKQASDGKLYGITSAGGTYSLGVLFQYDPATNILNKQLDFNGSNGRAPRGDLMEAADGKLYGMTYQGGVSGNNGLLFSYDPAANSINTKIEFTGTNGKYPYGSLMQASDGKLYGLTVSGGTNNYGVLFQYETGAGTYVKKFDFDGSAHGRTPYGSLMQAANSKLYGLTCIGGIADQGSLFEYDLTTAALTKKVDFLSNDDGFTPGDAMMQGSDGMLYGTTNGGGANNMGVIYQFNPATHVYTKKIDFNGPGNGSTAGGGTLLQASDGKMYGVTYAGGATNFGVLYQYDPFTNTCIKKYDFTTSNGYRPTATLIQANDGKLYGTTNDGRIFQYNISTNVYTPKASIPGAGNGSLLQATDGKLYGLTSSGGMYGWGTLFQYDLSTNVVTKKIDFTNNNTNGGQPYGSLIQAPNGKLYGMTRTGGANLVGVMFEYDPFTNVCTKKVDFAVNNSAYGDDPYGTLLKASNGKLYGLTSNANASGGTKGTLFEYDLNTSTYSLTASFSGANGASPYGDLLEIGNTIQTSTVIPASQCVSSPIAVPFTVFGGFGTGNIFTAQLSDATGSFASPVNLGSIACSTSSVIIGTIPMGSNAGSNYRIRVISSSPSIIGLDNGSDITISALPLPVITVNSGMVCRGQTFTLTPGGGISYTFLNGSGVVTPTTNTSYTVVGTDANGCSDTAVSIVSVLTPSITLNGGNMCSGQSFTFTPTGAVSYTYSSGSAVISPTVTSTYTVTGIDANGCISSATNYVTVTANPTVNATASNSITCSSLTATLTASGAAGYTWTPGGLTGNPVVVSPTVTTTYTVTGNSGTCANTKTLSVNVLGSALSLNAFLSNSITCATPNTTLTVSGATSYTWNPGNVTGNTIVISPTVTTNYTVTGSSGACSATRTINVGVSPGFTLNATALNDITCISSIATCTASGASSYTWSGPGIVSGSNSPTVQVSAPGIYTVAGSSGSCVTTKTVSVLSDIGMPVVIASVPDVLSCNTLTAQITITTYSAGATTYNWSGASITSGAATGTITVNAPGLYSYTVTNNSNGCSVFGSTSVSQNTATPVISISDATLTCQTATVELNVNANLTTADYSWLGAGIITSPFSPTITVNVAGNYSCSVTNTITGCSATASANVYMDSNSGFTVAVNSATVCEGSSVVLTASGAASYLWSTGANTSTLSVQPAATTGYTVSGINASCTDTQVALVTVDNTCQDVWPGDANSDGLADNLDVLELGLHYTQAGAPRSAVDNSWQSFYSTNWVGTITNGKNANHSDCNGDGIIGDDDTLAIYTNYGLTHAFKPAQTTTVTPELSIVPDQAMVVKGTWGSSSVYLGDVINPINSVNGTAFTVDFDQALIEPTNIYINYENSFLNVGNQNLNFRKPDFSNGKIFTATTHTINNNVSGNGKIATIYYMINSGLLTDHVLNLGLSSASKSEANGSISPLTVNTATVMAIASSVGITESNADGLISISPNPSGGNAFVTSSNTIDKIEVTTVAGQVVLTDLPDSKTCSLNLTHIANGIYFVKIYNATKQTVIKKIVIQK